MKREKAENLTRLISLLSTRKLKAAELAKLLNVQTKQIKRYFQVLDDLNLHVDEDLDGRCFIFGAEQIQKSELDQPEKLWLRSMIKIHADTHPFAAIVSHKLQQTPAPLPIHEQLTDHRIATNFDKITRAINAKVRIHLIDYHSPTGFQTQSTRLVEPLEFLDDHRQLKAYEIASRKVKSFKLDRIGEVKITEEPCIKKPSKNSQADPFGFSCSKYQLVNLKLSPLAKDLLCENYPLARPFISFNADSGHVYHGPMSNPIGIGRFILGLPGNIEIIEGAELKAYLKSEIQKYNF